MSAHGLHDVWPGVSPVGRALRIAGLVVLGVIGIALFALVFGWLVMILWNWIMPALFSLGRITYWQSFGIVILAKLIFGGVGGHGHHGSPKHKPNKGAAEEQRGPDREDWRFYKEFWESEGREAFERFVREKAEGSGPAPQSGQGT